MMGHPHRLHWHAYFSAICPYTLDLNGDDKRFSADDIVRVIEPRHRLSTIQLWQVNLNSFPHVDINIFIRSSMESLVQHCIGGLPPLDGDDAAAYQYELCTIFEAESEVDTDSALLEDFIILNTTSSERRPNTSNIFL